MFLASLLIAAAQTVSPERPDPATLGPGIGTRLPAFELRDSSGALRSMQSLMGPNGLVLVFFRSADW